MNNRVIKKMLLNQGKWKWETVEGVPPLTLDNSKYGRIKDYKIFGNSVQDGEPTPEAPIQIESVGDYVHEEADVNFGKYKIPVVISNETEGITTNIYLDEPLRKMGNYSDYIDYENKKIIRQIVEVKFDGSENWNTIGADVVSYFYLTIGDYGYVIKVESLCSHFTYDVIIASNNNKGIYIFNSGGYHDARITVRPGIADITTLELWKEYLAEQYDNGTPVTAYYVLTEPTEEEIELPDITALKNSTVGINTAICPDNMAVTYKKKLK